MIRKKKIQFMLFSTALCWLIVPGLLLAAEALMGITINWQSGFIAAASFWNGTLFTTLMTND